MADNPDTPDNDNPELNNNATESTENNEDEPQTIVGYKMRQCGCLWILYILGGMIYINLYIIYIYIYTYIHILYYLGLGLLGRFIEILLLNYWADSNSLIYGILLICWALATIWTQIEDRGDHLLLTYGPWRWCLCGMGKEKIPYDLITDFEITKTCSYGFGINCNTVKLFNTCSCFCGPSAKCCKQNTVRITFKERPQALGAMDDDDCFCERCCFNCFCGEKGRYIGKGCCFQPFCNPCNANCCMMNTIFVSTNDAQNLMALLAEKTGRNNDGKAKDVTVTI